MQVHSLLVAICLLLVVTTTQAISPDDRAYARALLKSIDIQHPKYFVRVYESEVKKKGDSSEEKRWNIVSSKDSVDTSSGETTRLAYVLSAEVHVNNNIVIEYDRKYIDRLGEQFEGNIQITAKLLRRGKSRAIEIPGYYEIGKDTTAVVVATRSSWELAGVIDQVLSLYNVFQWPFEERKSLENTLKSKGKRILDYPEYSEDSTLFRQYERVERNVPDLKGMLTFLIKPENYSLLNALAKNAEKPSDPRTVQTIARQILEDLDTLAVTLATWRKSKERPQVSRNLYVGFRFRLRSLADLFPNHEIKKPKILRVNNDSLGIKVATLEKHTVKAKQLLKEMNESLLADLADVHINLRAIGAEPGDEIRITITNLVNEEVASRPLILSLKVRDLNGHVFLADSFLLLKRLDVNSADIAQGIADVNFQPAPGTTFGYVWWNRSSSWRILRPGFGVNVSFLKFDDENVDIHAGVTGSLFGNMVHATIGNCLTCQKKRAYWGLGFSFTNIVSRLNSGG